jgi:putative inorganic carbon (hco3(-)) transporter
MSLPCLAGLLILTQSRSALFGTAAALLLIAAVRSRRLRWLIAIGTAAGLAALLAAGPQMVAAALFSNEGGLAGPGASLDLAGREEVWSRALYALQDFPFTGVGLGQFEPVVNAIYPTFLVGADENYTHAPDVRTHLVNGHSGRV